MPSNVFNHGREYGIGIFEENMHNAEILEALFRQGPLTKWGIVKQIKETKRTTNKTESIMYRTNKLISVLAKKGGCLERLRKKEYLLLKGVKWELNLPKADAILIKKPELVSEIHPHYYISVLTPDLGTYLRDLKAQAEGRLNHVPLRQLTPSKKATEELHMKIAAKLKSYLDEGQIVLDRMSNRLLTALVVLNLWCGILKHARESLFQIHKFIKTLA
ncbi:unnamed protein product [marine sediment metagenome]|uniref:Uncharacterized protein n=1 Tax=marine sediment metagenome TaxID=412755 RepID=X1I2Z4_9ZZZZ